MTRPTRWFDWFVRRHALLSVALSTALLIPTLSTGLMLDDYFHWEILGTGSPARFENGSLFGLFNFADGVPDHNRVHIRSGLLPWWATEGLQIAFWRPLTEVTHWLDYALWPNSPVLMHLHNVLWYALLIILISQLYRALDPDPVRASVAVFLYAICGLHGFTICWIANRSAPIGASFGIAAAIFFVRWRQAKHPRDLAVACATFSLSLLSAEAGIVTMAYLAAYALVLAEESTWKGRLAPLLPFVVIAGMWKFVSLRLGYGSFGSSLYVDPVADTGAFLTALVTRFPRLVAGSFLGVPASASGGLGPGATMALVVLLGVPFWIVGRSVKLWQIPTVRFFALSALLGLIPACAVDPDDRLLLLPDVAAKAVLAAFLVQVFRSLRAGDASYSGLARPRVRFDRLLAKTMVALLSFVHLFAAPMLMIFNVRLMDAVLDTLVVGPALSLPGADATDRKFAVLVNSPVPYLGSFMNAVRKQRGLAAGPMMQIGPGTSEISLLVQDEHTVDVSVANGFVTGTDRIYRRQEIEFRKGDAVDIGTIKARVLEVTSDGRPQLVRFVFSTPIHSHDWTFYEWNERGYKLLELPGPGGRIVLPAKDVGAAIFERLGAGKSDPS